MYTESTLLLGVLLTPLISAVVIALFLRKQGDIAAYLSCFSALAIHSVILNYSYRTGNLYNDF